MQLETSFSGPEPLPIGSRPRERILLFAFGTTHTKQYGDVQFDRIDAQEVMRFYHKRGVRLAWDVEHASARGGPAEFQEGHGWSGLEVDQEGLWARTDWNELGQLRLTGRRFVYDSPEIRTWRGNHLRAVEALSLVKEPARDWSIPLLMNGRPAGSLSMSTTNPVLGKLTGSLAAFLSSLQEAQTSGDAELQKLSERLTRGIADDAVQLNAMAQQQGVIPEQSGATAPEASMQMSARSELEKIGAAVLKRFGVKDADELRGALDALDDNVKLLSGATDTEKDLLLQLGVKDGKVRPGELESLKKEPIGYVRTLLSGRQPVVNTKRQEQAQTTTAETTLMSGAGGGSGFSSEEQAEIAAAGKRMEQQIEAAFKKQGIKVDLSNGSK